METAFESDMKNEQESLITTHPRIHWFSENVRCGVGVVVLVQARSQDHV